MAIKALCIADDADRPTVATFIGLRRLGVDVTVVCPPDAAHRGVLEAAGVPLLDLRFRSGFDPAAARRLSEVLDEGRFDILHVFTNKSLQNGIVAVRGRRTRLIAYRGIVGNVSFLNPMSWRRFLNPRIDRIVCVADAVREYFLGMRPAFLRVPAAKLVTIHKGHSLDWYTAAAADLGMLGIPEGAFTIACVANYRPRKGIEVLVDAMGRLPADCPAHLLLIGEMSAPRLARAIAASPARDRIHPLGFRGDAPSITAACDVFVLPSTKREGLARSLIEAMAYGVAPVVTDCGGSPEVVMNGECGFVVPGRDAAALAEAVAKLHADPALRRRFGAAARARIGGSFRIEDTIAKTHALYRELVGAEATHREESLGDEDRTGPPEVSPPSVPRRHEP